LTKISAISANNLNNNNSNNKNFNNNTINVEDVSEDEMSITSVKGEGFGSDLSDNDVKSHTNQFNTQRNRTKKSAIPIESSLKRPNTPMDFRGGPAENSNSNHQTQAKNSRSIESAIKNVRFQQFTNDIPMMGTTRFNEWDPYRHQQLQLQQQQNERQKSPQKSKPQQQQQQTNFTHSFLNQDSSPRQASGRMNVGSATQKLATSQQPSQFVLVNPAGNNSNNQMESNNNNSSTSNFDLVISGQKLGPRKESPTNTPRDSYQQLQHQQQQSQKQESNSNQQRSYTRRLQPLDKNANDANFLNNSGDGQGFKQKRFALIIL
jgi:hypothetical protein